LGVLLYELLTGKTPFDTKELLQAGLDEMRRTIREKEPERPSTKVSTLGGDELTTTAKRRGLEALKLINALRGDLDWIVMKCLEKDRARRYETANGLAMDIQRHVNSEPVVACPPSNLYRFQKMVARNQLAFAVASAVALSLAAGALVSTWALLKERKARQEQVLLRQVAEDNAKDARIEAGKAEQVSYLFQRMLEGAGPEVAKGRDATILLEILDKTTRNLSRELTNQPAIEADVRHTIAWVYHDLGRYNEAESVMRKALDLAERSFPQGDSFVGVVLNDLGGILRAKGNLAEADTMIRKSLAMQKTPVDGARRQANLANLLAAQGKYSEAEATYREALAVLTKHLGENNGDVAKIRGYLAALLQTEGKVAEAEAMERNAITSHKRLYGEAKELIEPRSGGNGAQTNNASLR
jgi:tetratricopeptide (TPR) repeat protein